MTTESWRLLFEAVTAISTGVAATAAFIAFRQLRLTRIQLADMRAWNRMSFAIEYLSRRENVEEWAKGLNASFLHLIDRREPLSGEELKRLLSDEEEETRTLLTRFLNALESYSLAVNLGIADEETAKRMYRHKFARHYHEMKPFIEHRRGTLDTALYVELETLVGKWAPSQRAAPRYPIAAEE